MFEVSPSDIDYLPGLECQHQDWGEDHLLIDKIMASKPTLQIIGGRGAMFALNSSLLLVYKTLQHQGRLGQVSVERVSLDKIPPALLSHPQRLDDIKETGGLLSISACVTAKEEMLDIKGPESEESDNFYDESDFEDDSDFEDFECVVCKLVFSRESRFDHHRRVTQHWGCRYCHLVFHSSDLLDLHKEVTNHWTDDDFEERTDTDDDNETVNWDELERLL